MSRKWYFCGALVLVIAAAAVLFFVLGRNSYIDPNDQESLIGYLSRSTGSDDISILQTAADGSRKYCAVLYEAGDEDKLLVLKQKSGTAFEYFGEASSSQPVSTYNYGDEYETLIIIYGDNTQLNAASYTFCNNGSEYQKDDLGGYILDVYLLEPSGDPSSSGYLYDPSGNELAILV